MSRLVQSFIFLNFEDTICPECPELAGKFWCIPQWKMKKMSFKEIEKGLKNFDSEKNKIHWVRYAPILFSKSGKIACDEYGLKPYINGDFRRDPDFENKYPSITVMNYRRFIASPVKKGDIVIFWVSEEPGKKCRLVAILKVVEFFSSHQKAANWYRKNELVLPSNCVVKNNPIFPFELTKGKYEDRRPPYRTSYTEREYLNSRDEISKKKHRERMTERQENNYNSMVKKTGGFIVTENVFMNLDNPPLIKNEEWKNFFEIKHRRYVPFYIKQKSALVKLASLLYLV